MVSWGLAVVISRARQLASKLKMPQRPTQLHLLSQIIVTSLPIPKAGMLYLSCSDPKSSV